MFNKTKIEFFSFDKPFNYLYPIDPISNLKLDWIKNSANILKESKTDTNNHPASHLCSGIRNLMQTGYIVQIPFDIAIKTNGDGETIGHLLPEKLQIQIDYFSGNSFGDVIPLPPQTLKTAIKIPTKWGLKMPKGWQMLMLPVNYYDQQLFTCATGILDASITNHINPILYWHGMNGEYLIKAGTPLCQLIPIYVGNMPNFEIRDITNKEIEWYKICSNYFANNWNKKNYKKLSEMYYKFFDKPKKCPFNFLKK